MHPATVLRRLLASGETLVMPDAYDPVSARIIELAGYGAVQCSGFSMALAAGWPSEAEFPLEQNLAMTAALCRAVQVPVMADAEDGFANAEGIGEVVRAYLETGVGGMNIEDQVLRPPGPKRLVPGEVAVARLQAARQAAVAAGVPDLVLNARTDALTAAATPEEGLAEAIVRANMYLEVGGDLAFVVGVSTLEQVRTLAREIVGPVSIAAGLANNLGTLSVTALRDCGVARVSFPSLLAFAAVGGMRRVLESVRDTGAFDEVVAAGSLCTMPDALALMKPQ